MEKINLPCLSGIFFGVITVAGIALISGSTLFNPDQEATILNNLPHQNSQ